MSESATTKKKVKRQKEPIVDEEVKQPAKIVEPVKEEIVEPRPLLAFKSDGAITEHRLPMNELVAMFTSSNINANDAWSSKGLSTDDAVALLAKNGPNELTPPKEMGELERFARQFLNLLMILLMIAGFLSLAAFIYNTADLTNLYLAIILLVAVVLTCTISYIEERGTAKVMRTFQAMLPPDAAVMRNGEVHTMPTSQLVVGDLVKVTAGMKVPADMRVLACRDLRVENSSLTGESLPVVCNVHCTHDTAVESRNVVFHSSLCITGEALCLVLRTGDNTMIGAVARLASHTKQSETTLQIEIKHFVRFVTILAVAMGVIFFIIGMSRGLNWFVVFITGFVTIIAANVPQGLPATVTSLLTLTAKRLRQCNMFVKRLDSVETLGSINLIASDKTGTLTQNKLTVVDLWIGGETVHAPGVLTELLLELPPQYPTLHDMHSVVAMCSGAQETIDATGQKRMVGNPVDIAMLQSFGAVETLTLRNEATIIYERPFNSRDKNHITIALRSGATIGGGVSKLGDESAADRKDEKKKKRKKKGNKTTDNNDDAAAADVVAIAEEPMRVFCKGAPEILLRMSTHYLDNSAKRLPIDEAFRKSMTRAYESFARNGCRVLGFCVRDVSMKRSAFDPEAMLDSAVPSSDFSFIGLVAMQDPPRERVPEAVAACQKAGIKVFVVTGDHPLTARAIAKQVGILQGQPDVRHEGNQMLSLPVAIPMQQEESEVEEDKYDVNDESSIRIKKLRSIAIKNGVLALRPEDQSLAVVHGSRIEKLTKDDWDRLFLLPGVVFARTTPQHKLTIVQEARARGFIVAVTGDGVNDAPALKAAHVGVAMGLSGTSVAREAAAIILTDDNFASIVDGIREGRVLFDNLKKTIAYTLTHLGPEVVPIMLTLAFSFPLGLTSMLILSIDLGTELAPAISLAYEEKESDVMAQPPRNVAKDRLVSAPLLLYAYLEAGIFESLICVFVWLMVFYNNDVPLSALPWSYETQWKVNATAIHSYTSLANNLPPDINDQMQISIATEAASAFYLTLVLSQLWHIWFCKTRRLSIFQHTMYNNLVMNLGVLFSLALMCIIIYVPGVQSVFGSASVPGVYWAYSFIALAIWFSFNESRKLAIRKRPRALLTRFFTW